MRTARALGVAKATSINDEWATPEKLYAELDAEFHFSFDPCPLGATDGLLREWSGRVYCNPPYSNIAAFLDKARVELAAGRCEVAVFLLPARTGSAWFHEIALPEGECRFIRGRLHFNGKSAANAPFDSMVLILLPPEQPPPASEKT